MANSDISTFRLPVEPGTLLAGTPAGGMRPVTKTPAGIDPANLAKMQEKLLQETGPNIPEGPVSVPTPVDIDDLPDDKRAEMYRLLGHQTVPPRKGRPAAKLAAQPVRRLGAETIQDDKIIPKGGSSTAPTRQDRQEPTPADPASAQPAPEHCSHCGWATRVVDDTAVSDTDKTEFVYAVVRGQRFSKTYTALGGQMAITFRGLTSSEVDTIYRQVVMDAQADEKQSAMGGEAFYWRNLNGYRLVLSLARVASVGAGAIEVPTLEEHSTNPRHGEFPLLHLHKLVFAEALKTEHQRNIAALAFREFQDLQAKLEARSRDPNFYPAIA